MNQKLYLEETEINLIFKDLRSLVRLDLSNCEIHSIHKQAFHGLSSIGKI